MRVIALKLAAMNYDHTIIESKIMREKVNRPNKWNEDWYLLLSDAHKLFYDYITTKAKRSGIWRTDKLGFGKLNPHRRINMDKFLEAINKIELRISVLPDNTWYLHYHIADEFGSLFNPKNNGVVAALKEAFEAGVRTEWIKGFRNHDQIDRNEIMNRHSKRKDKKTVSINFKALGYYPPGAPHLN